MNLDWILAYENNNRKSFFFVMIGDSQDHLNRYGYARRLGIWRIFSCDGGAAVLQGTVLALRRYKQRYLGVKAMMTATCF